MSKPLLKFYVVRLCRNSTAAPRYVKLDADPWEDNTDSCSEARVWKTRAGAENFIKREMLMAEVVEVSVKDALMQWGGGQWVCRESVKQT